MDNLHNIIDTNVILISPKIYTNYYVLISLLFIEKINVHVGQKQNVFGLSLIIPVLPLGVQADWSISSTNILKIQENTKL